MSESKSRVFILMSHEFLSMPGRIAKLLQLLDLTAPWWPRGCHTYSARAWWWVWEKLWEFRPVPLTWRQNVCGLRHSRFLTLKSCRHRETLFVGIVCGLFIIASEFPYSVVGFFSRVYAVTARAISELEYWSIVLLDLRFCAWKIRHWPQSDVTTAASK